MNEGDLDAIPEHESPVRRLFQDSHGQAYRALKSLEDARQFSDAVVIFEGDDGGQIYLTCPLLHVACDEDALLQLLRDLDSLEWNDPAAARMYFERVPVGGGVSGGMGGGVVVDGVWVHPRLRARGLSDPIEDVITGRRVSVKDGWS